MGNTRTALYNYLWARHNQGNFILRIEDTDQKRFVKGSEAKILEILQFLGLIWDEGPYRQSDRLELYQQYARELVDKGVAYEAEGAIRLRVPPGRDIVLENLIHGKMTI